MKKTSENWDRWMEARGFTAASRKSYLAGLKAYRQCFNDYSEKSLFAYKSMLLQATGPSGKKYSPHTINLRLSSLNSYMEFYTEGSGKATPKLKLITIQENQFAPDQSLSEANYKRICTGLLEDRDFYWYTVFRFLCVTGLRVTEARSVQWQDLHKARNFTVTGKGEKSRTVWLPSTFRKECEKYFQNEGPLINCSLGFLRYKLHTMERFCVGPTSVRPHECRRFFAKQFYKHSHRDLKLTQALMGHASINTTARYLRIAQNTVSRKISTIVRW